MLWRMVIACLILASATADAQVRIRARAAFTPTPPLELRILTQSLPDGPENVAYTCPTITATGGTTPYTWSTSGTLPTGITVTDSADTAVCGGTPTVPGTYNFTLIVTDNAAVVSTQAVQVVVSPAGSALPAGWQSADIGQQGTTAGTVGYADNGAMGVTIQDVWTITSSAPNIPTTGATTTDSFRGVCSPMTDDGAFTARVLTITGYAFAQTGVMLRQSLTDNAPHMFAHIFPTGNGFSNQRKYRATAGGATSTASFNMTAHYWIRVARAGNVFTASFSTDGVTWVQGGDSVTITMTATLQACLAITNIDTSTVATATFDNLTIAAAPPPPPPDETEYGGYRSVYQGYGATSVGGRGDATKVICVVTSRLSTAGTPTQVTGTDAHATPAITHHHGTFSQCSEGINSSFVVFDVGGYVELGAITLFDSNLTIAGQTSGAPVILRNGAISIDSAEQVWQHIQVRGGDNCMSSMSGDAFQLRGGFTPVVNVVFDHVSMGWCQHGAIQITGPGNGVTGATNTVVAQDILLVDSIIGDSFSGIPFPLAICFTIIGNGTQNVTSTMARNYWVSCGNRGPWIPSGVRVDFINNLNYNAVCTSGNDGTGGFAQVIGIPNYGDALIELSYVGNVNVTGPNSTTCNKTVGFWVDAGQVTAGVRAHLWDNSGPGCGALQTDAGQAACAWYTTSSDPAPNAGTTANTLTTRATFLTQSIWFHAFNYALIANANVRTSVLEEAGPFPMNRDPITLRLIGDIGDGGGAATGGITTVAAMGGWPAIADTTRTVVLPQNPYGAGTCGTTSSGAVRLVIECWLENDATFGARRLEPRW